MYRLIFLFLFPLSCGSQTDSPTKQNQEQLPEKFGEYWYRGLAEITTYRLEQARYGEVHDGYATMIFVTEPFSKSKQVKLDQPEENKEDALTVLKLNFTRQFNTGIYPYTTMTSVFTPLHLAEHPQTLKVTTTSQEWCGHTFMQVNHQDDRYVVQVNSYFESEGDQNFEVDDVYLEDGLWNRIRLGPQSLPTGSVTMLPATLFARLRHEDLRPLSATATLTDNQNGTSSYVVRYDALRRTLSIQFSSNFPYDIVQWEETHRSGFGDKATELTTKAVRLKSMMIDYWNKNQKADEPLRKALGLPK